MARKKYLRKIKKFFRRSSIKRNAFLLGVFGLLVIVSWGVMTQRTTIPQTAYTPLLEVIAEGESKGNYNAYFSSVANKDIIFTHMTINDVLKWQEDFVKAGNASSAVGRYQIIRPTLLGLVKELKLTGNELYDETMQNRLAVMLMERRGSIDFIKNELSAEDFAHQLSKEWAALPRVIGEMPESSFYAGDGLNRSLIDSQTSLTAVQKFKDRANTK